MSDDISADMLAGFEYRRVARNPGVREQQKRQRAAEIEQRTAMADEIAVSYPEVDVHGMLRDGVDRDPSKAGPKYLRAVAGGLVDGWEEALETVQLIGYALSGQKHLTLGRITPDEAKASAPDLPDIKSDDDTASNVVRAVSQFASVGGPVGGALRSAGVKGLGGAMASGAAADFSAFDPADGNLSTLARELGLENEFTAFIDSTDKGEFEGRLLNALEGAGIGAAIDGIMVSAQAARKAVSKGEGDGRASD